MSHHGDGDSDLSFEALTFGEDSNGAHVKKEIKSNKKKAFKKERSNGPQSVRFALHIPASSCIHCLFVVTLQLQGLTLLQDEKDKSLSSVYVSTKGEGDKIDVQGLLKRLEQFGVVKAYYFKEKQNFGFIQFLDASVCVTHHYLLSLMKI